MSSLSAALPRLGRRAGIGLARLGRRLAENLVADRDRWFLWATVLFGSGVAIYFALPAEPRLLAVAGLFVAAAALNLVWRDGLAAVVVGGAILAVAAGLTAAKVRTETAGGPMLLRPLFNADLAGYVELVEPRAGRGQRITLRVRELGGLVAGERPRRARVRLLTAMPLKPGDAIRLKATLAAPALPPMPGAFDFARSAWFRGIGAVGYAVRKAEYDEKAPPPPRDLAFWAAIETVRQNISQRITEALPGETGAIAAALITGERGGISEATNDAYRASGLYHMLSISGLHMVVMAGAAFWFARLLLALWPAVALNWPIRKVAAVAAALTALGYLTISGGAPATVRAWLMITIGFLAVLADRPAIALRTIALTALVMLTLFPETLLDVGFQMSFAAVVALVSAYEEVRARSAQREGPNAVLGVLLFFGGIVLSTVIAGFAVAPFTAYHFHQTQQYALLANLVAMPACNLIVMPAALAAMLAMPFGLETIPLWLMGWGIDLISAAAYWVAALPGAVLPLPAIPDLAFQLFVAGGLWLCLWRRRWRLAGLILIAAGMAVAPLKPRPDVLVGHDAALVAVRGADGKLAAPTIRGGAFEFRRWREHDGTPVTRALPDQGAVFRCDSLGCVATVAGHTIAAPREPAALVDDCRMADIVVVSWPRPKGCRPRLLLVDLYAVRDNGTHAIRFAGAGPVIETVQARRGVRPWTGERRQELWRAPQSTTFANRSRLAGFAAPDRLTDEPARPRPEVEDDEPSWFGGEERQ